MLPQSNQLKISKILAIFASAVFFFLLFVDMVTIDNTSIYPKQISIRPRRPDHGSWRPHSNHSDLKYILMYTKFFGRADWGLSIGRQTFLEEKCPFNNCFLTTNRSQLGSISEFDALLFHCRNLNEPTSQMSEKDTRNNFQRYVFFCLEAPPNANLEADHYSMREFFNWTVSYRRDSDIFCPYGYWKEKETGDDINPHLSTENGSNLKNDTRLKAGDDKGQHNTTTKRKLVAWIVSHCETDSKREDYVKRLSKYIHVDIFGGCGKPCNNCIEYVKENYSFYLAFENSLCTDYVTEKFWRTLGHGLVPIVYGEADYKSIAPEGSYINTKDFATPKKLANYLLKLQKNKKEYGKYLHWRQKNKVISNLKIPILESMCKLCEMLNDQNLPEKTYMDMYSWWNDGHCTSQ